MTYEDVTPVVLYFVKEVFTGVADEGLAKWCLGDRFLPVLSSFSEMLVSSVKWLGSCNAKTDPLGLIIEDQI